jgi:hypothetical protein
MITGVDVKAAICFAATGIPFLTGATKTVDLKFYSYSALNGYT